MTLGDVLTELQMNTIIRTANANVSSLHRVTVGERWKEDYRSAEAQLKQVIHESIERAKMRADTERPDKTMYASANALEIALLEELGLDDTSSKRDDEQDHQQSISEAES